jgi:hypothetical protein
MGGSYIATDVDGRAVQIDGDHAAWLHAWQPVLRAGSIWIFDTRGSEANRAATARAPQASSFALAP